MVAGSASIFGFVYLFFSDEKTGVLALLFFSVFLLGLLVAVWVGIIGMIKKENSNDYKKNNLVYFF